MTQEEALSILKTGESVFLTGEPGSGKSYTVNKYVSYLRGKGIEPAITASTGIAATHIGGMTIHSWTGIGIKNKLTKYDLAALADNKRIVSRIKKNKVLIIDEISMLSSTTFTTIDQVCRFLKKSELPFGGLQVVLVGDFFQLPPIVKKEQQSEQMEIQDLDPDSQDDGTPFAFRSPAWRALDPTVCYLSEQHRQEDSVFLDALSAIRRGVITDEARDCFNNRRVVDAAKLPEKTTKLFPHNANVDLLNDIELNKLSGEKKTFVMLAKGAPPLIESLIRSCLSPENLELKAGAKVMFTKNSPDGKFVNGTTGEVISFSSENGNPVVKIKNGKTIEVSSTEWVIQDGDKTLAAIYQLPLRLAWAITVHKSQGMSLDAAIIDLRNAFEFGQGYVALSRVRDLAGLHLLGFNERALEVHPAVLEQDAHFHSLSHSATIRVRAVDSIKQEAAHKEFIDSFGIDLSNLPSVKPKKESTFEITKRMLLDEKLSLPEIAEKRAMTVGTVISHLEKLVDDKIIKPEKDLTNIRMAPKKIQEIKQALLTIRAREGEMYLSQTREILGPKYTFDEIRLVRLFVV